MINCLAIMIFYQITVYSLCFTDITLLPDIRLTFGFAVAIAKSLGHSQLTHVYVYAFVDLSPLSGFIMGLYFVLITIYFIAANCTYYYECICIESVVEPAPQCIGAPPPNAWSPRSLQWRGPSVFNYTFSHASFPYTL